MRQRETDITHTPAVSIVVPIYNVEDYLDRCVQSILAQSFEDYELILVDDGSPDSCGRLCDSYAASDSRICVIHKDNGGLSDARNAGIEASRGKYLSFVDSDDYIDKEMIATLYKMNETYRTEIAICGALDVYCNREVKDTHGASKNGDYSVAVYSGEEALRLTLEGKTAIASVCCKMFLRSSLDEVRFRKSRLYEDAFFNPDALLAAERVAITSQPLYYYYHRSESITTEGFAPRHLDLIAAYEYTLDVVERRCSRIVPEAQFRLDWAYFVTLDKILVNPGYASIPEYKGIVGHLKSRWRQIASCSLFEPTRRVSAVALKVSVRLYRVLVLLHNRKLKAL